MLNSSPVVRALWPLWQARSVQGGRGARRGSFWRAASDWAAPPHRRVGAAVVPAQADEDGVAPANKGRAAVQGCAKRCTLLAPSSHPPADGPAPHRPLQPTGPVRGSLFAPLLRNQSLQLLAGQLNLHTGLAAVCGCRAPGRWATTTNSQRAQLRIANERGSGGKPSLPQQGSHRA